MRLSKWKRWDRKRRKIEREAEVECQQQRQRRLCVKKGKQKGLKEPKKICWRQEDNEVYRDQLHNKQSRHVEMDTNERCMCLPH